MSQIQGWQIDQIPEVAGVQPIGLSLPQLRRVVRRLPIGVTKQGLELTALVIEVEPEPGLQWATDVLGK